MTTDKFVFFWGNKSCFSNWHKTPFTHDGVNYNCSEQYMMYKKAMLFMDFEIAAEILKEKDPRKQKAWGREVRGYDDATWMAKCQSIMVDGLTSKFQQNPDCLKELLETGDRIIVEASPMDKVWGIGLAENDPRAHDQSQWLGQNLLGIVLMKTRDVFVARAEPMKDLDDEMLDNVD